MMFPRAPEGLVPEPEGLLAWMGVHEALALDYLLRAGSLDLRLAAVVWSLLASRASLVVAAGPRLAGKSTTLAALLPMLPPGVSFRAVGGTFSRERVRGLPPEATYLVVNEVSAHLPGRYLWDEGVEELLEARAEGYPFAATLHAASAEEVLETFVGPPLSLPVSLVRGIDVILVLRDGIVARPKGVKAAALVEGREAQGMLRLRPLVAWDRTRDAFRHAEAGETAEALARRSGRAAEEVAEELAAREGYLAEILADPPPSGHWREALARFGD